MKWKHILVKKKKTCPALHSEQEAEERFEARNNDLKGQFHGRSLNGRCSPWLQCTANSKVDWERGLHLIISMGEDYLMRPIKQSPETITKLSSTPGKHHRPKTQTLVKSHSMSDTLLKNLDIYGKGHCIPAHREK